MEKLKCRFCSGGDLVEMNGTYYCWNCGAKYVKENGELRLLKCKLCIGDLIDCGDHYECDLCGEKYEKAVPKKEVSAPAPKVEKPAPKPEPVVSESAQKVEKPAPKPEPVVSEPAQKEEKPVPKPEPDSQNPQEEEKISWEECLAEGCNALYNINFPNMIVNLKYAKLCYSNTILLIAKDESIKDAYYVFNIFITCFLAAFYHAYLYFNFHFRDYQTTKKDMNKTLDEYIAQFLELIYACTGKVLYTKMVTEKALALFAEFGEDSNSFEFFKVLEGAVGEDQKEISAMYWENYPGKYEKLSAEKAELEKEKGEIKAEEEKGIEEEERKTEAIRKEIEAAEKKWNEAWNRSRRLNFFQKKEKKRLEEEIHEVFVLKHNLEEKLKLREKEVEKNIDKIIKEWAKKDTELDYRIDEIETELVRNHYPFEDDFIEMFERKIRKVKDNFRKK